MSNNPELDRDIETIKRTADQQARKGQPLTDATPPLGAAEGDCLCPDMGTVHPDCPAHGTSRFRGHCPYQDGQPCNCRHSDPCPVFPQTLTDPVGAAAGLAPGWGEGKHSYHAVIDEGCTCPGDPSASAAGWDAACPLHGDDAVKAVYGKTTDELADEAEAGYDVEALLARAKEVDDAITAKPSSTGAYAAIVAREAVDLFTGPRNATYGDATDNFADIGNLWAVVFGHPVSPEQVAICSALIKVARLRATPDHDDSWTDAVAYLALGAGINRRRQA